MRDKSHRAIQIRPAGMTFERALEIAKNIVPVSDVMEPESIADGIRRLHANGLTDGEIAIRLGCSTMTVMRRRRFMELTANSHGGGRPEKQQFTRYTHPQPQHRSRRVELSFDPDWLAEQRRQANLATFRHNEYPIQGEAA